MTEADLKLAWSDLWEIKAQERYWGHDSRMVKWFKKYGEGLLKEVEHLRKENDALKWIWMRSDAYLTGGDWDKLRAELGKEWVDQLFEDPRGEEAHR